jgi:hypothetical protein
MNQHAMNAVQTARPNVPASSSSLTENSVSATRSDRRREIMKSFLSAKQVVAKLNGSISVKLVYALVAKGKLRSNRATGKLLIEEESLSELMAEKPETPSETPPSIRPRGRPRKDGLKLW